MTVFSDAVVLMFASYYCLNISYPAAQGATLAFLQSAMFSAALREDLCFIASWVIALAQLLNDPALPQHTVLQANIAKAVSHKRLHWVSSEGKFSNSPVTITPLIWSSPMVLNIEHLIVSPQNKIYYQITTSYYLNSYYKTMHH
ncbi:hypothetical protein L3Q82_024621 [Scortum barcoo]|uniref:Uncharacterized protein n=1 Tax=Scortum barcoo TaxID=214431 RepID=A0ACB8WPZ2_9TELE|nr:hypothetical protein L3Q82_024621 [Scortum barcoo]